MSTNLKQRAAARLRMPDDEYNAMVLEWVRTRSERSGDKLAKHFWGLMNRVAHRQARFYGSTYENVIGMAHNGLCKALYAYDEDFLNQGFGLAGFVFRHVEWAIMQDLPKERYRVALPSNVAPQIAKAMRVLGITYPLSHENIVAIAGYTGMSAKRVQAVYLAMRTRDTAVDTPVRSSSMGVEGSVEDQLEAEWPSPEAFAHRHTVQRNITRVLLTLLPREERILRLRFGINCEEHTLEQIGMMLDRTRERIRGIETKALRKLKHPRRMRKLGVFVDWTGDCWGASEMAIDDLPYQ